MPELPEVEVIVQGLRPLLVGCTIIDSGNSGKKLRHDLPVLALQHSLPNTTITDITRKAKYICLHLSSGCTIIIHLGMTGNLGLFPQTIPRAKHDHFWCNLDNDQQLRYNDIRRFGSIQFALSTEKEVLAQDFFAAMGPEPLTESLTGDYLSNKAKNKTVSVKTFIMTNSIVVGIGNIYANESLFMAGIDPNRRAKDLLDTEWDILTHCIKKILIHAIECGGSTISDFVNASQQRGYFQMNFKVYGKSGTPCSICNTSISHTKIAGRASYFCPHCQK